MKARIALWLGIGALIAVAAIASPLKAQIDAPPPAVAKPPAAWSQDLAFARFIALIRAHLLTGDELVSERQWEAATPHFGFPTEEVYGMIREDLRTYKTPPFDSALKALAGTVKAHNTRQYPKARKQVEDALAAADAALRSRQANWSRFVVAVAVETLKAAPDEYADAIAKGRVVRPIGYQTARGLILQAGRMFESAAGELETTDAAALGEMRAGFAQLKQTFGPVTAPKQAVIDDAAVLGLVSRIELAAGKLM